MAPLEWDRYSIGDSFCPRQPWDWGTTASPPLSTYITPSEETFCNTIRPLYTPLFIGLLVMLIICGLCILALGFYERCTHTDQFKYTKLIEDCNSATKRDRKKQIKDTTLHV